MKIISVARPYIFILLCAASLVAYLSNGRTGGSGDTVPNSLVPVALILRHTIMLDMFAEEEHRRFDPPYYLKNSNLGIASTYPIATGLLSVPIYLGPVLYQEWHRRFTVAQWRDFAVNTLQKIAASLIAALSVGVFYSVCAALGFPLWSALLLTFIYAFGSETFSTSSQGLWQHGPGCLMLLLAIRAFVAIDSAPRKAALFLSLSLGLAVAIRQNNLLIAAPIGAAALYYRPRLWLWLLIPAWFILLPLVAYNEVLFGTALGNGQSQIGDFALRNIPDGLLGSLISPARGLFLYFPASILLLFIMSFRVPDRLRAALLISFAIAIALTMVLNAAYRNWYGGFCFGPRYFTEIEPLILIWLGVILQSASPRRIRVAVICLGFILPYSIFIQYMGSFKTATIVWNSYPNLDENRSRLWDWRRNPIFSGLGADVNELH